MKTLIFALALTLGSLSAMAGDCPEGQVVDDATGKCVDAPPSGE
jgi:hypothetical protein